MGFRGRGRGGGNFGRGGPRGGSRGGGRGGGRGGKSRHEDGKKPERNMLTKYAPKANPKRTTTCTICSELGKYKCPKSQKSYCSVACYKKLREIMEKELAERINDLEEGEELDSDEDTVDVEKKSVDVERIETKNRDSDRYPSDRERRDNFKANFKDEDKVPSKLLDYLKKDVAMKNLLKNKRLQDILTNLQSLTAGRRFSMVETALKNEPVFREYADACLNVICPIED